MFFIKSAQKNIRRTPYQALAATMIMFLTFSVLSIFILLALGSQEILKFYESKPQAIAFFKDGTTDRDIELIKASLNETGKVTGFKYVSKEDALEIYKSRNQDNPLLLELVTANILPASLEISTVTPDDLKIIVEIIKKEPVVESVIFPEDVVRSLVQATNLIRVVGGSIVGALVTFSTLIIIMIIGFKIRIKRSEIEIMKLLGASSWFIRFPFILEGIFYGAIGAIMGWIASMILLWYFEPLLRHQLGEVANAIFPVSPLVLGELLLVQLLVAILVGGLGSLTAVRRYLHV